MPRDAASGDDFKVIDAGEHAIIPGLVNAHMHGHGGLSKGSGDRWSLELLLNAGGWLGGQRSDEDRYLSTLLAAIEMVQKGCTACFDLSLAMPMPTAEGMSAVAQAYLDAGMRAVVAPMVGDVHFYRAIPGLIDGAPDGLRREMEQAAASAGASMLPSLLAIAAAWPHPTDRVRFALAPTIPLHCTDEFLLGCHRIAREYGLPLQTHLAESPVQAVSAPRRYGQSITAHLAGLGMIDATFSGAHGVWLDGEDMALLGERGAAIAHNPGSNLRLGNGISRYARDAGARRHGRYRHRWRSLRRWPEHVRGDAPGVQSVARARPPEAWLRVLEAHQLATIGSARVLGMQDMIGRIAPGYKADLVFLDLAHINYVPLNSLINQLVHVSRTAARCATGHMVGGSFVVENRRVVGVDMNGIARRAANAAERLRAANRETHDAAERIAPFVSRFCHALTCDCALPHRRLENAG